jgi:hypothetical protein
LHHSVLGQLEPYKECKQSHIEQPEPKFPVEILAQNSSNLLIFAPSFDLTHQLLLFCLFRLLLARKLVNSDIVAIRFVLEQIANLRQIALQHNVASGRDVHATHCF